MDEAANLGHSHDAYYCNGLRARLIQCLLPKIIVLQFNMDIGGESSQKLGVTAQSELCWLAIMVISSTYPRKSKMRTLGTHCAQQHRTRLLLRTSRRADHGDGTATIKQDER